MRILAAATLAHAELARPSDRDCSVWHRSVLRHAYGAEAIDRVDVARWHLYRRADVGPWAPVEAVVEAGIGELVDEPRPGRWHSCQGWRGTPLAEGSTGHNYLWLAVRGGWGVVYDSTRERGQRMTGLVTWAEYTSQYHGGVAVAVLRPPPRG